VGTTGEALTKGPLGDEEVGNGGRKGKVKRDPPKPKSFFFNYFLNE
jgi:hypothetical protein